VSDATPAHEPPDLAVGAPRAAPGGAPAVAVARPPRVTARRVLAVLRTLVVGVVKASLRYRVTGLAAEAAFFALLSLPPLILGIIASLSYFADVLGSGATESVQTAIIDATSRVLTPDTVAAVVYPTLTGSLEGGRSSVISIGFVLALWSGSRALNVFIDTITIMYGLGGTRGIIKTRALSFSLYVVGLVLGVVAVPLLLAGPTLVGRVLPESLVILTALYWPIVILFSVAFLTTLYHLSVPVRSSWGSDLPGAAVALLIWIVGAVALRATLDFALQGASLYGPLAAPIAVLLWLYVTALAVLIGAAINAEIDMHYPGPTTGRVRRRVARDRFAAASGGQEPTSAAPPQAEQRPDNPVTGDPAGS